MTEEDLGIRLARLERDHRRLKIFALAAIALAVVLGVWIAPSALDHTWGTVKAREFDVVDGIGRVRARISLAPTFAPQFPGQIGATPAPGQNAIPVEVPSIELFDAGGSVRASMSVAKSGDSLLWLRAGAGDGGWTASAKSNGTALTFFDAGGNGRLETATDPAGAPSIHLWDQQGYSMALGRIGTHDSKTGADTGTSAASIIMFGNDKDGRVMWQAP